MSETTEPKMIQVPEAEFKKILVEIEKLKLAQEGKKRRDPKRVTEHTATLREWNEELIVGIGEVKNAVNKNMEKYLEIELRTMSGKTVKAPYLDFLNNGLPVKVRIAHQEAKEREEIVATGKKRDPAKGDSYTAEEAEFVVKFVDYTSDIEVLEGTFAGEKLQIENRFLNL